MATDFNYFLTIKRMLVSIKQELLFLYFRTNWSLKPSVNMSFIRTKSFCQKNSLLWENLFDLVSFTGWSMPLKWFPKSKVKICPTSACNEARSSPYFAMALTRQGPDLAAWSRSMTWCGPLYGNFCTGVDQIKLIKILHRFIITSMIRINYRNDRILPIFLFPSLKRKALCCECKFA